MGGRHAPDAPFDKLWREARSKEQRLTSEQRLRQSITHELRRLDKRCDETLRLVTNLEIKTTDNVARITQELRRLNKRCAETLRLVKNLETHTWTRERADPRRRAGGHADVRPDGGQLRGALRFSAARRQKIYGRR